MTGIKLFVWEHFNFTVSLNKKMRVYLRKFAARFADTIIVLTQKDVELWKTNLKVRAKIISINNPSPFPISNNKYKEESTTVIAVGRLKYQKGFDRLLKIWSDFKRIRPNGLWKLQIIGSGPEADKLKEQSMRLGIGSSVEWIENTAHIKRYYENAAFLAMTSRFEGLPMTLIEAQSFGLPIIAYDCLTGPGEVISKKSGFLIRNGDDDEFVDKLLLLSQDSSLRNRFSYSAREEVTKFSVRNIVMQWLSLLAK
ncbi:glycosyltransferase [Olivibacter sp. 47]|nr:glycosyltransferase [Olivibacter sp. 47]MDM8177221.1 glycosyltransferase [Olivibacter sp. 47]